MENDDYSILRIFNVRTERGQEKKTVSSEIQFFFAHKIVVFVYN